MLVGSSSPFLSQCARIVDAARRNAIPAIYDDRACAVAGGLISCGANIAGVYGQIGGYAARVLKRSRPAELPVLRPTTFDFVVNLNSAKALGIDVPASFLARADEVVE